MTTKYETANRIADAAENLLVQARDLFEAAAGLIDAEDQKHDVPSPVGNRSVRYTEAANGIADVLESYAPDRHGIEVLSSTVTKVRRVEIGEDGSPRFKPAWAT